MMDINAFSFYNKKNAKIFPPGTIFPLKESLCVCEFFFIYLFDVIDI